MVAKILLVLLFFFDWDPVLGYFANEKNKDFKFECLPGEHIYFIASQFKESGDDDRMWTFDCRRGFVSPNPEDCYWVSGKYVPYEGSSWFHSRCDLNAGIVGLDSKYHKDGDYRSWKARCCKLTTMKRSEVTQRQTINTATFREADLSLPRYYVPFSFEGKDEQDGDYVFELGVLEVAKCEVVDMTVVQTPETIKKKRKSLGSATTINCDPTNLIEAEIGFMNELEQGFELTTSKSLSHTFATTMTVGMEVEAGIVSAGASASVSMGGGTGSSEAQTVGNFETVSSTAVEYVSYAGPAASFVMGEIDDYTFEEDTKDVTKLIKCGSSPNSAADTRTETGTIAIKSTTYGRSHYTNRIAKFATAMDCITHKPALESCFEEKLKPTEGYTAKAMASLFEDCFADIPNVQISN